MRALRKVLAGQMKKNFDNKHSLTLLVNSIFEILAKEHPDFSGQDQRNPLKRGNRSLNFGRSLLWLKN